MRTSITSSFLERGKIPVVADTDREAFDMALRSCGHVAGGTRAHRAHPRHAAPRRGLRVAGDCRRAIGRRQDSKFSGQVRMLFDESGRADCLLTASALSAKRAMRAAPASPIVPIRNRSTPRAALRPSAIAQTMSDWPRCMSPAVNTPGTLVIQLASRHTLPRSVSLTPKFSSRPWRSGPRNPIASSTRSTSISNSVPGTFSNDIRPSLRTSSTFEPCSFLTRP